jgi:hypothetical protein
MARECPHPDRRKAVNAINGNKTNGQSNQPGNYRSTANGYNNRGSNNTLPYQPPTQVNWANKPQQQDTTR